MRRIKKLVAALLATSMVMAMGLTAFAAEGNADKPLPVGKYDAKVTLYKEPACTSPSMGNKGIVNPAEIVINADGTASFTLKTREFTYIGIRGALTGMTLEGVGAHEYTTHNFTVENLPASKMKEGSVLKGTFSVKVLSFHSAKEGYLKIESLQKVE